MSEAIKLWRYAVISFVGIHLVAYLLATGVIGTSWQTSVCLMWSIGSAIAIPIILALPEIFGLVAIVGFLNGIIPGGLRPGDSVMVALDKILKLLAYLALVNSFMFLFLATWPFGPFPEVAKLILGASLTLACWSAVYREGVWFKKLSLWYPAGIIIIALIATQIPGIIPGKAERAIAKTEWLLNQAQDKKAEEVLEKIQERIEKLSETTTDPRDIKLSDTDQKDLEWAEQHLTRKGKFLTLLSDPGNKGLFTWIVILIAIAGIFWMISKLRLPAISWKAFGILITIGIIAMVFQKPRDIALDVLHHPEVSKAFTGTETTKSVQATSLEPFKVCNLEPNASYTFVRATTSESIKSGNGETVFVYRTKSNKDGSVETHKVTGGFFDTPEELPYHDANYAGGILLNNVPPGRIVESDGNGCMDIAFNTSLGKYRSLIDNPWIGIYLRK